MAEIYDQSGEHVLINAVREVHYRPFQATDWTDLRVGFFLSVTYKETGSPADDEDPDNGAIPETITGSPGVPWTDRVQIGVTDRGTGSVFLGYTNLPRGARKISQGSSILLSSDIGVGTTNSRYWRFEHGEPPPNGENDQVHIIDADRSFACAPDGSQLHLVRDPATAGGYCTLAAFRFTRDNATSRARIITMEVKKATAGGHSSDILFSTDPSLTVLESQLEGFPTNVSTLGPIELSHVPDTMFFYWPFHQSRLRIHACGILKVA